MKEIITIQRTALTIAILRGKTVHTSSGWPENGRIRGSNTNGLIFEKAETIELYTRPLGF